MERRRGDPRRDVDAPLDVEVELAKERAEALGRAGHALEDAVRAYHVARAASGGQLAGAENDRLLAVIAWQLYRLVVQRECAGALSGNLDAIGRAYRVPEAAFRRL